ncbi:hypothetical protein BX070DRAFT_140702 [Coemansia spiralis]|nr:hypothetical protein BX070DRAFT_252312 [Coemansia spiralis]KAI9503741.1 hypothetical protein BX070DRAFT_140702 [Coemansia spiralis]
MCGLLNSVYSSTASQITAGAVARVLFNGFSWRSSLADIADIGLTNLSLYPKADYDSILITDSCKVRLPVDCALSQKKLKDHGVHTEIRSLAAGDYLWIVQAEATSANSHIPDPALGCVMKHRE